MGMDHPMSGEVVWSTASSVRFAYYTPEQIRRLSVAHITSPIIFDDLERPTSGGPYDPRLGPMDNFSAYVRPPPTRRHRHRSRRREARGCAPRPPACAPSRGRCRDEERARRREPGD